LSRTPAGRLGSTTYLVAPIVIVLAWLLLGEVPSWLAIAGGALCIGGVVVARSGGARPAASTRGEALASSTGGSPAAETAD